MSRNKYQNWIFVLGYVALIYSTIGVVRYGTQFLRSHNCMRLTVRSLYAIGFVLLLRRFIHQKITGLWRYAVLVGIFIFYLKFGKYFGTPEEEIHFIEYGLVGILFASALAGHLQNRFIIFVTSLLLATVAGGIDELLQKLYPSRVFDVKDILLNALSAFLGLVLLTISTKNSGFPDQKPAVNSSY
jgi:hypothetical protein